MCGHRTFAHLGVASFSYPALSSIANEVATIRLSSGGRIKAPFIMHFNHGVVMGTSSQHSESPQCMYWNFRASRSPCPSSGSAIQGADEDRDEERQPGDDLLARPALWRGG